MSANLNLSTGKEYRVSVNVGGWKSEHKGEYAAKAQLLEGVTSVQSAGGSTSFYIYYDPTRVTEDVLGARLTGLAQRIGAFESVSTIEAAELPSAPSTLSDDLVVNSSAWTGIANVQERIIAFKQLAPVALAAVDSLVAQLEVPGDNGGPPLDERQEAVEALRELQAALGDLLAMVDKPGFAWADGEGLAASCAHFAIRATEKLRDDPIPYAASGLVLALCSVFGFPGVGGWLGAVALRMQKSAK